MLAFILIRFRRYLSSHLKWNIALLFIFSLLGCDGHTKTADTSVQAVLNINETSIGGRYELDARDSYVDEDTNITLTHQELVITDSNNDIVLEQSFGSDGAHVIHSYFSPGTYQAMLTTYAENENENENENVQTSTAAASFVSTNESQSFAIDDCSLTCSQYGDNDAIVACTADSDSCQSFDLSTLVDDINTNINSDVKTSTTLWLRVAAGAGGQDTDHESDGGDGGTSQTITNVDDYISNYGSSMIYFLEGNKGGTRDGGASSIMMSASLNEGDSISMSNLLLVAGAGGSGGNSTTTNGGRGAYSASHVKGDCWIQTGEDGTGDDSGDGGGTTLTPEYSCDDDLSGLATAGSGGGDSGSKGIGGLGASNSTNSATIWLNASDISSDWSGDGSGGAGDNSLDGSGGGGFGGGGGAKDYGGGGGGGSFARSPTQSDGTALDSEITSGNGGTGYVSFVFNTASDDNDSYCAVSCEAYGDDGDKVICTLSDMESLYQCNYVSLNYILAKANSSVDDDGEALLDSTLDTSSTLWMRAHGGSGGYGVGNAGKGGSAMTVMTIDAYQSTFDTDMVYFLLGSKGNDSSTYHAGYGGASTLIMASEPVVNTSIAMTKLLLLAAGGGAGSGDSSGHTGGKGGKAVAYITGECDVAKGGDGKGNGDNGGGVDITDIASSDDIYAHCDDLDTDTTLLNDGAKAGGSNGVDGIGGMGSGYHNAATTKWSNNEVLNDDWIGDGNGGVGTGDDQGGGGGGGFGGGGGGGSSKGGGGGGSYASSPLTTDYAADDDDADSDNSADGYIEFIFNVNPKTSSDD